MGVQQQMEFKDLLIFKTLAEEGNVTKTAEKLCYVQSNITTRMKKLEQSLGATLFYRHSKGITLTSKGRLLLKKGEEILRLVEETETLLKEEDSPAGHLTIGANETTALVHLPPLLTTFSMQYPDVHLSLQVDSTENLVESVLSHELDGSFVVGPVHHIEVETLPVLNEKLVIITNSEEPFNETNPSHQTLLTRPNYVHHARIHEWLNGNGIKPARTMEFNTLEAIISCVKAGLGFSVLTKSLADYHRNDGYLHYHELSASSFQTIFIYRKDGLITKAFDAFTKSIEAEFLS